MTSIQYASFVIAALTAGMLAFHVKAKTHEIVHMDEATGWKAALLFWLLHGVVYYMALMVDAWGMYDVHTKISATFFTEWSQVLRLNGYLTFFYHELALLVLWIWKKYGQSISAILHWRKRGSDVK